MRYTPKFLRGMLHSMIRKMGEAPEKYVRRPGRDFTRPRTLTFETVISLLLTMSENSIGKVLIGRFQNSEKTPSAPAFVQQRQKLLPAAMETLFHRFTALLRPEKTFCGYRLAVDGSSLKSASYPEDPASYRPGTPRQHGWNLWHMNALFDLENGIYTDLIVQKEHEKNECRALCQMAERSRISGKVIPLADRNYESCNNLAHLEKQGWNYLIRIRDKARGIAYGTPLPDQPEFDIPLRLNLGRLTPRQLEARGIAVPESYYRILPTMTFDFLKPDSPEFYEISFRIVRVLTDGGSMETLITNLDPERFPTSALKQLYAMRWGIETSFRGLKYAVGLIHLHAKKPELVLQEIFASFLVYNFTAAAAWSVDTAQGASRYKRHVNFSDAVFACCAFLRRSAADPLPLLRRKLLPFRPGRASPRPKIPGNRISACYACAR